MRFFVSLWIFLPKFFYLCSCVHFVVVLSITYPTSLFERTRICLMVSCPQTSITCVMFGALLFLECFCVFCSLTCVRVMTAILAKYAVLRSVRLLSRMGWLSSVLFLVRPVVSVCISLLFFLDISSIHFHPCFIISTFSIVI